MPSASKAKEGRASESGKLLKGSDLSPRENEVVVFCNAVRPAPENWDAALIMDINPDVHGCGSIALNKGNIDILISEIGDDYDKWAGYDVTFSRVRVQNPKGGMAFGLRITGVKKSRRKSVVNNGEAV